MAVDLTKPVLVVDDYNTMIRIMHNLLKQLGFEQVDDANDGSSALAKLRKRDYGLVISDWNMIAAKKAGVSNYIVKPFNAQTLKNKIDAVFGEAEARAPAA